MLFNLRSVRIAATVLALTTLASCSKKDSEPVDTIPAGIHWTADGADVTPLTTSKSVSATDIRLTAIAGSAAGSSSIGLLMPKKTGTYALSRTSSEATATYTSATGTTASFYSASSGSIVVTALTATNVTGTFTFTADDAQGGATKKVVTNGKFNVTL